MTDQSLKVIHSFPSLESFVTNQGSVSEGDLSLIPLEAASKIDAENGTDNSRFMTPLRTLQALNKMAVMLPSKFWTDGGAWYIKWNNGWIEQGGTTFLSSNQSAYVQSLHIPFSSASYYANVISAFSESTQQGYDYVRNKATANFTCTVCTPSFSWYACGR